MHLGAVTEEDEDPNCYETVVAQLQGIRLRLAHHVACAHRSMQRNVGEESDHNPERILHLHCAHRSMQRNVGEESAQGYDRLVEVAMFVDSAADATAIYGGIANFEFVCHQGRYDLEIEHHNTNTADHWFLDYEVGYNTGVGNKPSEHGCVDHDVLKHPCRIKLQIQKKQV